MSASSKAQDIHFSQFYQTTILNNPAMTGIFNEDYRVGFTYRNQWSSVGTPFTTSLIDAETKVLVNSVSDYVSFGLLGYVDKAGSINFQTTGIYPAINYNKSLEDKYSSYLSVGFTGGYIQRSVDPTKMTFDNQYIGGNYVPSAPTGENITTAKSSYWDLGAGITFNSSFDQDNKINYVIGVAAYHITTPKNSFYTSGSTSLGIRWDGNIGVDYEINSEYALNVYTNVVLQSPYREIIGGVMARWTKPSSSNTPPFSMYVGAFYRYQDSWIPTLKLAYKKNSLTVSYDINTSSLSTVTNMHGAFEITLMAAGMWGGYDDKHLCPRF